MWLGWIGKCNSLFHLLSTWTTWTINKRQKKGTKLYFLVFLSSWSEKNKKISLNSQQVWIRNQVVHVENTWESELHLPFQPSLMGTPPYEPLEKLTKNFFDFIQPFFFVLQILLEWGFVKNFFRYLL
jgi:hypothetical protein